MFAGASRYFQEKERERNNPRERVKVSRQEFVRLMIESGRDSAEAELQAKMAEGLGSDVLIGERWVGIEVEAK